MKQKIILTTFFLIILTLSVFVSARMTFVTEDDGIYNIYKSEIILEKGWNLVSFGGELEPDSEIKEGDIKAIFYYNPSTKNYVQYYPESDEFNNLMNQNSCGDQSCNPDERESYSNWCYKDCKTELNDDIISHLNVISEKTFTLSKNEKKTIDFAKYFDMEIYWNQDSMSGSCSERGYSNVDCVMLHHDITSRRLNNDNEFINSPNDGNPYNDRFGVAYPIGTYTDQESVIYAKVDYASESGKYKFTFYEIDDDRVKAGYDGLPIPSVGAKIMSQPAWVYSNKRGLLKTEDMSIKLEQINLNAGWNFLTITPEMTDKSLKDLEGGCSITNAYLWDEDNQQWGTISNLLDDRNVLNNEGGLWNGLIVKVSNDCSMGRSSITPPPLPDTVINLPPENTPEPSDINFPETIGEFTLKSKNTNDKTECGELNGNTVCVQMSRIEYVTSDNRAVHILPTKITSGKESYINYIKTSASESNVGGVSGVYRGAEPWELYWFTNNDYDMIGTQDYKYIPQADGGYNSQTLSGTTTTSVAKWLLNKYPPTIN